MADITPGDLKYCFFTNGGAEANEMALKLARIATGGKWFLSAIHGFHGKSLGALSVTGKDTYRKPYMPMIQQVLHVQYGKTKAMERSIQNLLSVGESIAGIIVEPIQGEAGIVIPPDKRNAIFYHRRISSGSPQPGRQIRNLSYFRRNPDWYGPHRNNVEM